MNLTIDIGNTRTKVALFNKNKLQETHTWENGDWSKLSELITNQKVKKIIYSTVVSIDSDIEQWLKNHFYTLELTADTPLPIYNLYRTPQTLGKDRLAAVVGAYELYPQESCLIIDAGTCITYDILNAEGEFLGGNIAPGIRMRLKAMHTFTAKLPLVKTTDIIEKIGYSTESAMQIGGQWGTVLEMEGYIAWCKEKFGLINVILTGGDADFLGKHLKIKIFAHPNLVHIGLNKILNYNVEILE